MPKIHQLQNEFEEIEQIPERKSYFGAIPIKKLDLMLFGCVCNHLEVTHRENGKCGHNLTGLCSCKSFIPKNLEIKIEITTEDIFEFEVKDHSEVDSLNYWSEFNLWRIKNA